MVLPPSSAAHPASQCARHHRARGTRHQSSGQLEATGNDVFFTFDVFLLEFRSSFC